MTSLSTQLAGVAHHHKHFPISGKNEQRLVLIFPTWAGITAFEHDIAARLNAAGYSALVVDFFGDGADLSTLDSRRKAMAPFTDDLAVLQSHVSALIGSIRKALPESTQTISALGFCLGGLCALHAGLQEQEVDTAISFHGLLKLPTITGHAAPHTRFLILNGSQDPMVSEDEVVSAIRFFDKRSLDLTFVSFSGTYHSFMIPEANNPDAGVLFNPQNASMAWNIAEQFLQQTV